MEWVKVSDRLPDDKVQVLGFVKWRIRGIVKRNRIVCWYNSNFDFWENLSDVDMEITHWMPLPEPPKE